MKSKKGAIELSLNFIVIIIFSLVVLSLGILLIRNFFSQADDIKGAIEDVTMQEMDNLLAQGATVSLPSHTKPIQKGESDLFNLYVLNVLNQNNVNFDVNILFSGAYDKADNTIPPLSGEAHPDRWLNYVNSFPLNNNQAKKLQILVSVAKEAEKGTYIYTVNVNANGQSYGVKKIYVEVV